MQCLQIVGLDMSGLGMSRAAGESEMRAHGVMHVVLGPIVVGCRALQPSATSVTVAVAA